MTRSNEERPTEDELLAQLKEANPVPSSNVRGAVETPRARRILSGILGPPTERAELGLSRWAGRRVAIPLVAAGMIAALALLLTMSRIRSIEAGVADVLESVYVQSILTERVTGAAGGEAWTVLLPRVEELWIAADGSGRLHRSSTEPLFFSDEDRLRWEAAGSPPLGRTTSTRDFAPSTLTRDALALPTNPARLFSVIKSRAHRSDAPLHVEMFVIVEDLLREPLTPPAVRAALYRVAARIPDVELIGWTRDPLGRPGLAIAVMTDYSGALERRHLIFDPLTSAVLAEGRVLLEPVEWLKAKPPVTIYQRVEVTRTVVGSINAKPSSAAQDAGEQ